MRFTSYIGALGLLPGAVMGSVLGLRADSCNANNCARAVTGTAAKPALTQRQSDCASFLIATVSLPTSTITATATASVSVTGTITNTVTVTVLATSTSTQVDTATATTTVTDVIIPERRDVQVVTAATTYSPSSVPTYASACSGAVKYSSACSCWGFTQSTYTIPQSTTTTTVTLTNTASLTATDYNTAEITQTVPTQVTVTTTVTSTVHATASQTLTGIIRVNKISDNSVLGYIGKTFVNTAYAKYDVQSNALTVQVVVAPGSTSVSQAEIIMTNAANAGSYPFLGLVQGRDDTTSDLETGSFQYVYITGTGHTEAGSVPQVPGNSYTTYTGTSRTSESSIWDIDFTTGALTPAWVNPSGSPAPTFQAWIQGQVLYAGSSPSQFYLRYPSTVYPVSFTFISI